MFDERRLLRLRSNYSNRLLKLLFFSRFGKLKVTWNRRDLKIEAHNTSTLVLSSNDVSMILPRRKNKTTKNETIKINKRQAFLQIT